MTESVKLLDGKLTVFRRPASRFWWGGFYHKRTHHRVSTNCDDLEKAKQTATIWFYQKQAEFSLGIAPAVRQKTFSLAAEKAMETYSKSPRSKLYVTGLKKILNKSVLPFMDRIALEDVNQSIWHKYKEYVADRSLSRATLHQHKMAIRVVLVEAYKRGELKSIPDFKDDVVTSKVATPRTWFEPEEYKRLIQGAKDNIEKLKDTRWRDDAQEMLDYVEFIANTGMRVGEARNVRFCDVETIEDKNVSTDMDSPGWYLLIRNIKGKRGTGECKSNFEAFDTFMRIWDRRLSGEVDWRTSTELRWPPNPGQVAKRESRP